MGLLDNASTRERQLVTGLGVTFAVILVVIVPLRVSSYLAARAKTNQDLRDKITDVSNARGKILERKAALGDVAARYARPAPGLGSLIDSAAGASSLTIAVQSDVPATPRGKLYSERSTKLSIQKTGLRPLAQFMEKIETSGYPVSITGFDLTRRIEADSYTVNMTISAYDRSETAAAAPPGKK